MSKAKLLGGLAAVLVAGLGMDYIIPLLAPLDYVGISPPRGFFALPFLLATIVYCLATWQIWPSQDWRKSWFELVIRLLLVCFFCGIGFYVPGAYRQRQLEFIPVSGGLRVEQHDMEQALGFKVGVQVDSEGTRLFFKREPGASQKVREWLRQQASHATTP